jgi:hypothetical protein
MAGYGAFQFASPSQYGDWAQYAGLDRITGEAVSQPAPQQGVAPPEDLQGYMNQRLGSVQQKMAAIPGAFQQVGQGNVTKAAGMIRGAGALAGGQPSAPQVSMPTAGYDYTFGLDQ